MNEIVIDGGVHARVLDHGFVQLIETYGTDERIIEAARMSTQKGFEGWGPRCENCGHEYPHEPWVVVGDSRDCPHCGSHESGRGRKVVAGDEKLLAFLWKNRHTTPFEMAGAVFEVQAPIFVFREWHRHRTQSYNEMSARYAPLPDVNYVPSVERLLMNARTANKQAGAVAGSDVLTEGQAGIIQALIRNVYEQAETTYQGALKAGAPKELARLVLPVGRYSKMRASANLLNWMRFLSLRDAPNAQWEIQQYAKAVHAILANRFPRTMALFAEDHRV